MSSIAPLLGGIINTVAGDGYGDPKTSFRGDGGPATLAGIASPLDVALDASGNIYIVDLGNHRIRMVTKSTGIITTVAGSGTSANSAGFEGDGGLATLAHLSYPSGIASDAAGNFYIADSGNRPVRLVTKSTGIITTVVGNGGRDFTGDGGLATFASLDGLEGIALDALGNIYITTDGRVRLVTKSTGIITTVAGSGVEGNRGDGVLATLATLIRPTGVAIDTSGNIYFADRFLNCVRMVTKSTGIITIVAGSNREGYRGDGGLATSALLHSPSGIALDLSGNIYITDGYNNRIRKVTTSTGIITTVAGDGTEGYKGDGGPATSASLFRAAGVALVASGSIFIADTLNDRIRVVTFN
jgi:trimeric autotransporter adhesin